VLEGCIVPEFVELADGGLFVLDGSRAACAWRDEAGAPQAGTVPARRLPLLERRDNVRYANDSAWLSNPAAPLTGFSPLVSRDGVPQGARTRLALTALQARLRNSKLTADDLRAMALDDKVYLAELVLPDVRAWCGTAAVTAELRSGCAALSSWSGDAGYDANAGLPYLAAMLGEAPAQDNAWLVPFNSRDPVNTPHALNYRNADVAQALAASLTRKVREFGAAGIAADAKLGDFQVSRRGGTTLPIHGGPGELGIFNTIDVAGEARDGRFEVTGGTSYVQVVELGADGPRAQALLAYSQSSDPASPHHLDQTRRFAQRQWVTLPFTAAEIAADPALRRQELKE
jgi:acyl-homoserine-lactone acylase